MRNATPRCKYMYNNIKPLLQYEVRVSINNVHKWENSKVLSANQQVFCPGLKKQRGVPSRDTREATVTIETKIRYTLLIWKTCFLWKHESNFSNYPAGGRTRWPQNLSALFDKTHHMYISPVSELAFSNFKFFIQCMLELKLCLLFVSDCWITPRVTCPWRRSWRGRT